MTASEVSRFVTEQLALRRGPTDEEAVRRLYASIEYPSHYPAHGRLLVDPDDNVWIEDYPVPGARRRGWTVYSPSGALVASLEIPENLRVLEVGTDYVLGSWRDALGTPAVHVYRFLK